MDLREFLGLLHVDHGPSANGEYVCRCPAHDDKTASLTVREKVSDKDGKRRIYFCCQTRKCSTEDVLNALHLKAQDLIVDPDPPKGQGAQRAARRAAPAAKTVDPSNPPPLEEEKRFSSYESAYGYLGKFVCAYVYRGAAGKPLFEVARIDTTKSGGKREKTFRQHRLLGPGWTFPLVKGVPDELKDNLYNLPEVVKAIKGHQTVYLVEGEKDADSLAAMGLVGTTCAMGAGKWRPSHTKQLEGADVCILPDNDEPGENHAEIASAALLGVAASVRVVRLKDGYDKLEPHGDISDVMKAMGAEGCGELLRGLVKKAVPLEMTSDMRRKQAAAKYENVYGYCVDHGRTCQATSDGAKPLANFVALPVAVTSRDDGVSVLKEMTIDGWSASGQQLPRVRIKSSQFSAMNWVAENWDFAASIMPGSTTKDKLRYAISEVGRMTVRRTTEYTHTGWRQIGGKWCYLYQGGAIGAADVTVDLGSGLNVYRLDGSGAEGFGSLTFKDGAAATLRVRDCMAEHISIPMLGTMFLAPLREFLAATGIAPAYALFLLGGTGTRKSTGLALGLSHFGNFTGKNLPASFNDTANFIRKKAFLLKDCPIVVDDYHPVTSLQERKKMEATAQSLARAFGDGAERGRMRSDLSLQESMPPRGVAIISGEDTPGLGESGMARFYIVTVGKGDIPANKNLTELQEMARNGYLQKSMQGYIKWIAAQIDTLPDSLHKEFLRNRDIAMERTQGQHGRTAEAIAHMMLGYGSMLRYMRDIGLLTTEECVAMHTHAWSVATAASKRQAEDMREDRPTRIFLSTVGEMLTNRTVGVRDLTVGSNEGGGMGSREMIGYMDAYFYYLMPNMAYRAVARLRNDQGQAFPLTAKMLYKQLREDGVLKAENTSGTAATRPKWVDGKSQRLLWIPRSAIDGPAAAQEQQRMDVSGFTPVDDEDIPEEFR